MVCFSSALKEKPRRWVLVGVFLTQVFCIGWSQIPDSIRSLPTAEVVSVRLLRHAAGQQVVWLDSATLVPFALRSVADLLAQHTALDVRLYGSGSGTLSLRGGGASHTAVVWQGINLQNMLSGVSDVSLLPVAGMQRVGIKAGGESALFGSGAVGGVVLLDSQAPTEGGFGGKVALQAGSFRDFRQHGLLQWAKGKWAQQVSFTQQNAQNSFPFRNVAALGQPIQYQVNAQQRMRHFLYDGRWRMPADAVLSAHVWHTGAERQLPPTMIAADVHAYQTDRQWRGVLEYAYAGWRARTAFTDEYLYYTSDLVAPSRNWGQNALLEVEHGTETIRGGQRRLGIQYLQNRARSNNYATPSRRHRVAAFAAQTFPLGKNHTTSIALRQEWVDKRWIPLTGSIGTRWGISAHLKLRSALTRNYNLPALNDLYWAQAGDPTLRPERSWSGEVGVDWENLPAQPVAILFSATFYGLRTQDRIQWTPQLDGRWRPSNLYASDAKGTEVRLQIKRAFGDLVWQAKVDGQYTYARTLSGERLLYVPAHSGATALGVRAKRWGAQYRQTYSGTRPMTTDGSVQTHAFTLGYLEMQYGGHWGKQVYQLTATVQNVWNVSYQLIQYYAMPCRNVQLQAAITF